MQSSSRSLPFKQSLAGASPATDAIFSDVDGGWLMVDGLFLGWSDPINPQLSTLNQLRSQGVISSARRFAKAEVRGAIPRESAISAAVDGGGLTVDGTAAAVTGGLDPSTINFQPLNQVSASVPQ